MKLAKTKRQKAEQEEKTSAGRNETTILGLGGTPVCFVDRPPQPFTRVIRY